MPPESEHDLPSKQQETDESQFENSIQKPDSSVQETAGNNDAHNDFQVIETELNQHIKEAGLFYQSLGDSLRRMESAHKKIYVQHKYRFDTNPTT